MNQNSPLIRACLVLTLFCGVSAVIVAIVAATTPIAGSNAFVLPVLNTLVTMFGLGVGAFFFKGQSILKAGAAKMPPEAQLFSTGILKDICPNLMMPLLQFASARIASPRRSAFVWRMHSSGEAKPPWFT